MKKNLNLAIEDGKIVVKATTIDGTFTFLLPKWVRIRNTGSEIELTTPNEDVLEIRLVEKGLGQTPEVFIMNLGEAYEEGEHYLETI